MVNEYGKRLDRNGYAPSVFDMEQGRCFHCGMFSDTARHEVFHGPYRAKSKALGFWVNLCPSCHNEVHNGANGLDLELKKIMQHAAMLYYGWYLNDWRERFSKNYLEDYE